MSANPISALQTSLDCATATEIQKHFAAAMNDLFCLAYLLTAHAGRAEESVIRAIRKCMKSTRILREQLPAWVRNSVIRHGIAIANESTMARPGDNEFIPVIPPRSRAAIGAADYSSGIFELSNFDRLVYVICVLEHYTSLHCALLLRSSRSAVRQARARALAHISGFESRWRDLSADLIYGFNGDVSGIEYSVDSACGSLLD